MVRVEFPGSESLVPRTLRRDRVSERRMLEFLTNPPLFSLGVTEIEISIMFQNLLKSLFQRKSSY